MSTLSDEQIAKIAYYSAGGFGDQVIERIEAAIREALVLQAKSHAAVAEVVEPKRYDIDQSEGGGGLCPGTDYVSSADYDLCRTALTHATLAKEAADASVGRLMDETQRMAKLYDAMEDRAEAAEKEAKYWRELSARCADDNIAISKLRDAAEQRTAAMEASSMEMRRVLELLDSLGGLGHDKHAWIRDALAAQSAGGGG